MDEPTKPKKDWSAKLFYSLADGGMPDLDVDPGIWPLTGRTFDRPALFPVGPRDPVPGHHWFPTGPTNLGGRVRSLAIDPTDDKVVYAGASTGGVFKTTDGGETWTPLWHVQQSLAIASIAVAPSEHETLYVATGEPNTGPVVPGGGIFRFTTAGGWQQIATGESLGNAFSFERIVVHPTDPAHVWAVGARGVFRSLNATSAAPTFTAFDAGVYCSDAAFGAAAGGAPSPFVLYLCRARTDRGEIVRIDQPADAAAAITTALTSTGNRARTLAARTPVAPPGDPRTEETVTLRGKLTVCRDHGEVVYAAFAENDQRHVNRAIDSGLRAIVRSTDANSHGVGNFSSTSWVELRYRNTPMPNDFALEDFGWYMLTIAVSPKNKDHVFFGMVDLFFCLDGTSANPTWHEAMLSPLWRVDPVHHSDHHAIVFENTGAAPAVWVGNDGGLARCDNYAAVTAHLPDRFVAAPPPLGSDVPDITRSMVPRDGTIRWQRRVDGLVASQAYDLTQSPLVPTMYGCGHQDWGVWYTAGGDTWRRVLGADGGFVAWDPVDPFRFLATHQGGIFTLAFAGTWDHAISPPDIAVDSFLNPRELTSGFHEADPSRFVADTAYHPRREGRIITTRSGRAYASDNGESFRPLPIGNVVEILAIHEHEQPGPFDRANLRHDGVIILEIVGGTAAAKLGLFKGVAFSSKNRSGNPRRGAVPPNPTAAARRFAKNLVGMRGLFGGPFPLADGDTLKLRVRFRDRAGVEQNRALPDVVFHTAHFADIAHATASEVGSVITAALGVVVSTGTQRVTVEGKATFHASPAGVELISNDLGPGATLEIGGSATALAALGIRPGTYHGLEGRPAAVTLQALHLDDPRFPARDLDVALTDGDTLTIRVSGGDPAGRTVTFRAAQFGNLAVISAEELARVIQTELDRAPPQPARAVAATTRKLAVVLRADQTFAPDAPRVGASTALERLTGGNVPAGVAHIGTPTADESPEHELRFVPNTRYNGYDLAPTGAAPLRLRLVGAAGNLDIDFDGAGFVDRARATVEETVAKIRAALTATSKLRCEVWMSVPPGDPTEIAYDRGEPPQLWIGTEDGRIFKSPDDGQSWREVQDPAMVAGGRAVEAIAIDPRDPQTIYVGLGGGGERASELGALFVTRDGGGTWSRIGDDALVQVDRVGIALVPHRRLAVNAIVIDPESSQRLWVATDAGVFESTDAGAHFSPMSEGMPNTKVTDLEYVPGRQMLRAALWGRGAWARDVGPGAPPAVSLYVRTSMLDDGAVRPTDDGLDGFGAYPRQVSRWESPDIKVTRLGYTDLGATDDQIDTAEFDQDIVSEPIGQHAAAPNDTYNVFVQVHNRSQNPSTNTRVIVLRASCGQGIPDLPPSLWSTIGDAVPTAGSGWELVGVATIAGEVTARRPRVMRLTFTPPPDVGVATDLLGILVLVSGDFDRLTAGPVSVRELLAAERRSAFRLVPTRTTRETEQLVLRALDGIPFKVAENGPATFRFPTAVLTDCRSETLAASFDAAADATRELVVTTQPPPPGTSVGVSIRFRPEDLRVIGADPTRVTPVDARRLINRALRLGPVGVRCVAEAPRIVVRSDSRTADLLATPAALPDPAAELRSGAWLTRDRLARSTANHVYARIRNAGGALEPSLTWRMFWFDPAAATIPLDVAHQLGTGTIANLSPGSEAIVDVTFDPGATTDTHRGVLLWASSPGDPVHAPAAEPFVPGDKFDGFLALDGHCVRFGNTGYRLLELVPP